MCSIENYFSFVHTVAWVHFSIKEENTVVFTRECSSFIKNASVKHEKSGTRNT